MGDFDISILKDCLSTPQNPNTALDKKKHQKEYLYCDLFNVKCAYFEAKKVVCL